MLSATIKDYNKHQGEVVTISNLKKKVKVKSLNRVRLFVTPWTRAYQAPPSMGFPRQEYWSGLPFPSPEIFPTQGLNPGLPHGSRRFTM